MRNEEKNEIDGLLIASDGKIYGTPDFAGKYDFILFPKSIISTSL